MARPMSLCGITTAMISTSGSAIFAWLAAAAMATMLATGISGSTSIANFIRSPSGRCTIRPRMIGSSTTLRIETNIADKDAGSHAEASSQIGVGGDQWGEQGGHRGDRYRQDDVATDEPGHHVGSGAPGIAVEQKCSGGDFR
ncbi:hypothetical protein D9M68_750780 [compost metagenome]